MRAPALRLGGGIPPGREGGMNGGTAPPGKFCWFICGRRGEESEYRPYSYHGK